MRSKIVALGSLLALAGALLPAGARADEAANQKLMMRFYDEVCNQQKIGMIDELVAPDFVDHDTSSGFPPNREGLKQFFQTMYVAFPDMKFNPEYMVAKDDRVLWYGTMTGTQKGPMMGMPATNKSVTVNIFDMVRFANGKAVEHWGIADAMSLMMQMGMMPEHPGMGEKDKMGGGMGGGH